MPSLPRHIQARRNRATKLQTAYDWVDWEKIGEKNQDLFERPGLQDSAAALDTVVVKLTRITASAVDKQHQI